MPIYPRSKSPVPRPTSHVPHPTSHAAPLLFHYLLVNQSHLGCCWRYLSTTVMLLYTSMITIDRRPRPHFPSSQFRSELVSTIRRGKQDARPLPVSLTRPLAMIVRRPDIRRLTEMHRGVILDEAFFLNPIHPGLPRGAWSCSQFWNEKPANFSHHAMDSKHRNLRGTRQLCKSRSASYVQPICSRDLATARDTSEWLYPRTENHIHAPRLLLLSSMTVASSFKDRSNTVSVVSCMQRPVLGYAGARIRCNALRLPVRAYPGQP